MMANVRKWTSLMFIARISVRGPFFNLGLVSLAKLRVVWSWQGIGGPWRILSSRDKGANMFEVEDGIDIGSARMDKIQCALLKLVWKQVTLGSKRSLRKLSPRKHFQVEEGTWAWHLVRDSSRLLVFPPP